MRHPWISCATPCAIALAAIACATPVAAVAQEGDDSTSSDEIVVTAQKYAQPLTKTPLSISVINADALATQRPVALEEALARVPGLYADRAAGGITRLFIRGIGDWSDQQNKRVAFLIDGVPQTQAYLQDPALAGAMARIEVIKGPQGTLYGRGAVAGVISVVSLRPTEMRSSLSAGYGSFDARELVGTLAVPLGADGWAIAADSRLSARESWEYNDHTAMREPGERRHYGRLRLEGRIGETRLLLSAYALNDRTAPMRVVYLDRDTGRAVALAQQPGGFVARPLDDLHVDRDFIGRTTTRAKGVSGQLDWRALGGEWRSITSYSRSDVLQRNDADGTAIAAIKFNHDPYSLDQAFFYQDAIGRFSPSERFHFQLGGSASVERTTNDTRFDLAAFTMRLSNRLRTESYAGFGQADWAIASDVTVTLGVRHQEDRYRFLDLQNQARQSGTDGATAWRAALGWQPSSIFNAYVSMATAQTPGGVNTTAATSNTGTLIGTYGTYAPEQIRSVEVGAKGQGTGWRYALAAYVSQLDDQQIYNPANTQIENLGLTRYRGIELEGVATLMPGLAATLAGAWTDSEIERDETGLGVGRHIPNIAPLSARGTLSFTTSVGRGKLRADLTGRWRSRNWADTANTLRVDPVGLVDVDLRWQKDHFWIGANVANLGGKAWFSQVFPTATFVPAYGQAAWAQPRTMWLRAGVEW